MQLDVDVSPPASAIHRHCKLLATILSSLTYTSWDMNYFIVWILVQWRTDGLTESDAYEPIVHKHRCAQKQYSLFGSLVPHGGHMCIMYVDCSMLCLYVKKLNGQHVCTGRGPELTLWKVRLPWTTELAAWWNAEMETQSSVLTTIHEQYALNFSHHATFFTEINRGCPFMLEV